MVVKHKNIDLASCCSIACLYVLESQLIKGYSAVLIVIRAIWIVGCYWLTSMKNIAKKQDQLCVQCVQQCHGVTHIRKAGMSSVTST
jgi:hypothetical protein